MKTPPPAFRKSMFRLGFRTNAALAEWYGGKVKRYLRQASFAKTGRERAALIRCAKECAKLAWRVASYIIDSTGPKTA